MHPEIAEHIRRFPDHMQEKLGVLHTFFEQRLPKATQKIAYGIPTFQLKGKNFIHYAGYSKHIGLYPGAKAIAFFAEEFDRAHYKFSKGAVQFPANQELPFELIEQIITYLQQQKA